ncbi:hypothetical protein FXO37_05541 [Capsicum annuum]|nr:hypothetical protein FXO37_05541 [Capsicum annuum]
MTQCNINESNVSLEDIIGKISGAEHSERVRCMGMGATPSNTFVNTKRRCSELSMSSSRYGESSTTSTYLCQKVARFECQLEVTLNALKNYIISKLCEPSHCWKTSNLVDLNKEINIGCLLATSLVSASIFSKNVGRLRSSVVGMSFSSDLPILSCAQNMLSSEFGLVVVSFSSLDFASFFVGGHEKFHLERGFSNLRFLLTSSCITSNNFSDHSEHFGLSRLSPNDASHVSTTPQGTAGYVDPEYHECYQFMTKLIFIVVGLSSLKLISACC